VCVWERVWEIERREIGEGGERERECMCVCIVHVYIALLIYSPHLTLSLLPLSPLYRWMDSMRLVK